MESSINRVEEERRWRIRCTPFRAFGTNADVNGSHPLWILLSACIGGTAELGVVERLGFPVTSFHIWYETTLPNTMTTAVRYKLTPMSLHPLACLGNR